MKDIYIDPNYLVANHVILNYSGKETTIHIPAEFNGFTTQTIGAGAFQSLGWVDELVVPKTVRHICFNAFRGTGIGQLILPGTIPSVDTRALEPAHKVVLADLPLDPMEYAALKNSSAACGGQRHIALSFPQTPTLEEIGRGMMCAPACPVPGDVPFLCWDPVSEWKGNKPDWERVYACFPVAKDCPGQIREIDLLNTLSALDRNKFIRDGEAHNDAAARDRVGSVEPPEAAEPARVCIFTFDDSLTRQDKRDVFITATVFQGHFFIPETRRIVHQEREYLLLCRHYLPAAGGQLLRKEIGLFHDGQPVLGEEAWEVYEKYQLLTAL